MSEERNPLTWQDSIWSFITLAGLDNSFFFSFSNDTTVHFSRVKAGGNGGTCYRAPLLRKFSKDIPISRPILEL